MTGLITDPGFDKNRTEEYKLSIQVSLDGFSFSVIHVQKRQLLALKNSPFEISSTKFLGRHFKKWVHNNDLLQKKYHSTTIKFYPESLTFVPFEFYDSHHLETIGGIVFGSQNGNQLIDNNFTNASGNLVFPVSKNLLDELKQLFPEQKLFHPATVLDKELNKLNDTKTSTIVLYFGRKSFTIVLYANSQLKAINNYTYASSADVIYYTIAAVKKIKLVPDKTTLFMAGEVIPKGEIHTSLKKVFNRTIFFIPEIKYDSDLFKEPLHRYIVLF